MNKLLSIILTIAMLFGVSTMAAPTSVSAASKRTKAVKAYKKYLKNHKSTYNKFSLIYLDNNSVPELLGYRNGFVDVFTCSGSKVKNLNFMVNTWYESGSKFKYYKKTGVFRSSNIHTGICTTGYPRLLKGKIKSIGYSTGEMGVNYTYYYKIKSNGAQVRVSKAKFKAWIKSKTKGKKIKNAKFYSNTAAGRKKHCK